MDNRRRFIRFEVRDFLEMRALKEPAKVRKTKTLNFSLMGICFYSQEEWSKGQVLLIDYFLPQDLDSVRFKVVVVWSEFVDDEHGYLTGTQIIDIEKEKEHKFANYYFQKLKEKYF